MNKLILIVDLREEKAVMVIMERDNNGNEHARAALWNKQNTTHTILSLSSPFVAAAASLQLRKVVEISCFSCCSFVCRASSQLSLLEQSSRLWPMGKQGSAHSNTHRHAQSCCFARFSTAPVRVASRPPLYAFCPQVNVFVLRVARAFVVQQRTNFCQSKGINLPISTAVARNALGGQNYQSHFASIA